MGRNECGQRDAQHGWVIYLKKTVPRVIHVSPATSATGMRSGGRRWRVRRVDVACLRGGTRLESHLAHLLQSHTLGNRNRRHGGDLLARKLDDILLHHAGARERRLHAWRREIGGGGGMKGQRCDSNEVACASRASKRVQRARFEPLSAAASSRDDQRPYARRHEITPNPITLKESRVAGIRDPGASTHLRYGGRPQHPQ